MRFDQRIYLSGNHERLARLWVPLLPFDASLPPFLPPRLMQREVERRLCWTSPVQNMTEFACRRAVWRSGPPPPGSAFGTVSIAFQRETLDRLELSPWTDELATWCVTQIWCFGVKLYPATLSGAFERIGRLSFALGAAQRMELATPSSQPAVLDVREYPYSASSPEELRNQEVPVAEQVLDEQSAPASETLGVAYEEARASEVEATGLVIEDPCAPASEAWRLARVVRFAVEPSSTPESGPDLAPGELFYSGTVEGSYAPDDLHSLRSVTKRLACDSVHWAMNLYERQLAVFATHDSARSPVKLLGTESQDRVIADVCRDACREASALAARYYAFDWAPDAESTAARPHLVGEPVVGDFTGERWPSIETLDQERRDAIAVAEGEALAPRSDPNTARGPVDEGAETLPSGGEVTTASGRNPRPQYLDKTEARSPTAFLPLELLDKTLGILVLTFPAAKTFEPSTRRELERRAAQWLQRLSIHRLIVNEGFSSAMLALRRAAALAKGQARESEAAKYAPRGAPPVAGETQISILGFLERFCTLALERLEPSSKIGVVLVLENSPVHDRGEFRDGEVGGETVPDSPARTQCALAWVEPAERERGVPRKVSRDWQDRAGAALSEPYGTPGSESIAHWGGHDSSQLRAFVNALTRIFEGEEPKDSGHAAPWLETLRGDPPRFSVFTLNLPIERPRVSARAALSLILAGAHHLGAFHRDLLAEFASHLGEALGELMERRYSELRKWHEQRVDERCTRFADKDGDTDPVGILFKRLGTEGKRPKRPKHPSADVPAHHWRLADDALLWVSGFDDQELIALAGRGNADRATEATAPWPRAEHPWIARYGARLARFEESGTSGERLRGRPRLGTFDLRERRDRVSHALLEATGKPWLVSVPLVDARRRFFGILDLLRTEPIAPEEHAIVEGQLERLGKEFCGALERGQHERLRHLELNLHSKAAELLREYKTVEVHHAIVKRIREHFDCAQVALFLAEGKGMVLAASTRAERAISHDERPVLEARGKRRRPLRVGEGDGSRDVLLKVCGAGSRARPIVAHRCAQGATGDSGLSEALRERLGATPTQERMVVPVFSLGEGSRRLEAILHLVEPVRTFPHQPDRDRDTPPVQPEGPGDSDGKRLRPRLFKARDVSEAQGIAQALEPILRLVRVIDEHGVQVNELVHSLGQPLQALRGAQNQLLRGATRTPRAEVTEIVRIKALIDEHYHSVRRVKDRLGFLAQLYRPAERLHWEPTSLELEIRKAIRAAPRPIPGVWFHEELAELPEIPVDRAWLGQALVNLCDNAAKYAHPNTRVDVLLKESENGNILITVRNRGVEIPTDAREKIFEPYYRAEVSDPTGPRQGSGLGLALVREAVERVHCGRVKAYSEPVEPMRERSANRTEGGEPSHLTSFVVELSRPKLVELAKSQAAPKGTAP